MQYHHTEHTFDSPSRAQQVISAVLDGVGQYHATTVLLDLTAGVAPDSTAKAVEDMRAVGVEVA